MAFDAQEEVVKRRALQPEEDATDKVDRQCKRGGSWERGRGKIGNASSRSPHIWLADGDSLM